MKARTKRAMTHAAIGGFTLAAVGLRIGFWLADTIEFGIPGATPRNLIRASRAARRDERGGDS
jgi:hypothetical protein